MRDWYAGQVIMYVQFKHADQNYYPVWENIYLIEAQSDDEAFEKAEKRGRESEGDDGGTFRWDDKPARWVYGGVRKITRCQTGDHGPEDGTELSFIQMRVRNEADLRKLIDSDPVSVKFIEPFAESDDAPPPRRTYTAHEVNGDAVEYVRSHAGKIHRAVVTPASPVVVSQGEEKIRTEIGMVLYLDNGDVRYVDRRSTQHLLNEGVLNELRIKIELPT